MKRLVIATLLGLGALVGPAAAQQASKPPLTNASVVKLVKAGFSDKTVIAIVQNRKSAFNLAPEELIQLKRQGVSENVILAMLASQDATFIVNEDEEWASDEQFFKGGKKSSKDADGSAGGSGIFGSGGSSQSQSRENLGSGGGANDGNVEGSATVRIVRPPATAGGAATPKLDKTPTLDNDGVVRLVEAGFSEGTIIKRIEESPVDFDLSPAKLAELQKRRVSDSIIAAMSAAMGVDAKPKP